MAITLTESAAKIIQTQLAKRGKGVGLRVGVEKVGCSSLAYTFDYADEVRASDLATCKASPSMMTATRQGQDACGRRNADAGIPRYGAWQARP